MKFEKIDTTEKAEKLDTRLKQNRVVQIKDLIEHPDNYRRHPAQQVRNLMASLGRFGQGRSIVVQDGPAGQLIVAGHGIVEAAKRLNYTELRADILPADWSAEQVKGYLVADNQHVDQAEDDQEVLLRLLQEQQTAGYDLATLGADQALLDQLLDDLGQTPDLDSDDYNEQPIEPTTRLDKNVDERLDVYNTNTIRQIVLLMTIEEFATMIGRFRQVRDSNPDLETNTDVVRYLTDYFVLHQELPPLPKEVPLPSFEDDQEETDADLLSFSADTSRR